jgi:hypothetical protein
LTYQAIRSGAGERNGGCKDLPYQFPFLFGLRQMVCTLGGAFRVSSSMHLTLVWMIRSWRGSRGIREILQGWSGRLAERDDRAEAKPSPLGLKRQCSPRREVAPKCPIALFSDRRLAFCKLLHAQRTHTAGEAPTRSTASISFARAAPRRSRIAAR